MAKGALLKREHEVNHDAAVTPLHRAIFENDLEQLQQLLDDKETAADINVIGKEAKLYKRLVMFPGPNLNVFFVSLFVV